MCSYHVSDSDNLIIERCFGILLAHGRKVKDSDMNLLEMVSFYTFVSLIVVKGFAMISVKLFDFD